MPDTSASQRQYSPAELAAARLLRLLSKTNAVIFFAGGEWWPQELERRAAAFDRKAAACRLLAPALRREQAAEKVRMGESDA